jgi:uncharacterized protein
VSAGPLSAVPLLDHHCHGVVQRNLTEEEFEGYATESDWGPAPGTKVLDSPFGVAMMRICGPVLDLHRLTSPEDYLGRRQELGWQEVTRRLLAASGTTEYLVETGFPAPAIASPGQMGQLSGHPARRVVRLETIAELVAPATSPAGFVADFEAELDRQLRDAVGVKTVAAYRCGLDLTERPPSDAEVERAAAGWLRTASQTSRYRIADPTLISRLVWCGVERRTVVQVHVGFGDADVRLDLADPSRLTPFLRATRTSGARIALLHCYPFVRQAGILAHLFPHVWFDVSCLSHYAGPSAPTLIRQAMETAPFGKLLYASDAYALAEQYLVSATLWRRGLGALLEEWVRDGWLAPGQADRYAAMIGAGNAQNLYRGDPR